MIKLRIFTTKFTDYLMDQKNKDTWARRLQLLTSEDLKSDKRLPAAILCLTEDVDMKPIKIITHEKRTLKCAIILRTGSDLKKSYFKS